MNRATQRLITISKQFSQGEPLVKYQTKHQFLTLTLNRPKKLNVLNINMIDSMIQHIPLMNQHQAMWIEGAGGKALCAGADIKSIFGGSLSIEEKRAFFKKQFKLNYEMTRVNAIKIACWDGVVMGAGFSLTAHCPFIIATENTKFAMPETKIGFITIVNYVLSRLRSNIGYYLAITSDILYGEDVYISGLANYFVPSSRLQQLKNELIVAFNRERKDPQNIIRQILEKYHAPSGRKTIKNEKQINHLFAQDNFRNIEEHCSKINDNFHSNILEKIKQMCPLSMILVQKLLKITSSLTLKDSFELQFETLSKVLESEDVEEGVRCLLINKGQKPKWSIENIFQVKQQQVEKYISLSLPQSLLIQE